MLKKIIGSIIACIIFCAWADTCSSEGAIAVGRNQRGHWFGVSANHQTIQEAQSAAMGQCRARGESCSMRATFRNTCIAIVFGILPDRRSGYEWTGRSTLDDARNAAMSSCRNRGGNCELKYSSCDNIDEAAVAAQRRFAEQSAAQAAQRQRIAEEAAAARAAQAQAEAKSRQAEENARNFTAALPGQTALWNPVSQIGSAVGILLVLLLIKSLIEKKSEKQSVPIRIAIGAVSSTISGLILFAVGVKSEFFLLAVPIGGGFLFALIYDSLHA